MGEGELDGKEGGEEEKGKDVGCGEAFAPPDFPAFEEVDKDGDAAATYVEIDETAADHPDTPPQFVVEAVKETMDTDKNANVTKEEYCAFLALMETPEGEEGLHKLIEEKMGEMEKDMQGDECVAMDTNGDGKISKSEAFDFVSEMDHADLNQATLEEMWDASDVDPKDGFLSIDECRKAGEKYEGDGNEAPGTGAEDLAKGKGKGKGKGKLFLVQKKAKKAKWGWTKWLKSKVVRKSKVVQNRLIHFRLESAWVTRPRTKRTSGVPSLHAVLHHTSVMHHAFALKRKCKDHLKVKKFV